jgi:hypothetical protein
MAFRIDLGGESVIDLSDYDVTGRRVATLASGSWRAGSYHIAWSARDAAGRWRTLMTTPTC